MTIRTLLVLALLLTATVAQAATPPAGSGTAPAGKVEMIPIETPHGRFKIWTKRVGDNPKLKLLLLHGGPAMGSEYFEIFDSHLPQAGIEYIYYDQLGSYRSDQPNDDRLWTIDRFVEEVEQVRKALKLDSGNFCLLGHSWGGILAMEYALKYQANLKCLVISNMMSSIPAYNDYAKRVLMPKMDQALLAEALALEKAGRTADPRYMEILTPLHYEQHFLRRPAEQWPDPVKRTMGHVNGHIYTLMQGPSELGASGRLEHWDRTADLPRIRVPTLVIAAGNDTMDPAYKKMMADRLPRGEYLLAPVGGHMAMYDDEDAYFKGLISYLKRMETRLRPDQSRAVR